MTYYVSIGNSDDKLTQAEWADYVNAVDITLAGYAVHRHGVWFSATNSAFQNACWCFDIYPDAIADLKAALTEIRKSFRQDSIAWAEAITRFI